MDARDGEMAPWREQMWAAVVILSAVGGVFLALGLLIGAYADQLEFKYICGESSCEIDRRPWLVQRALPLSLGVIALVGCVVGFVAGRAGVRRERAAARTTGPASNPVPTPADQA